MQSIVRTVVLAVAVVIGVMGVAPASASAAAGTCRQVTLNVALAAGQPASKKLSATLCQPNEWAPGPQQVDVLIHGGTYNRSYWDFPVDPSYSYVNRTLQAGRATFALDQIGAGASSKPLSLQVTANAAAFGVDQAVQWLRTTQGFDAVNLIGHSVGSFTAMRAAATYQDVDRLVVTGAIHAPGVGPDFFAGSGLLGFGPAALDPQFAGQGLDLGYLTSSAQARADMFYNESADPQVIAYDAAHKDILSATHLAGMLADLAAPPLVNVSGGITAPVLLVMGEDDLLFCGLLVACTQSAIAANEAPYYPSAESFTTAFIPNTGHNLALHPTAGDSFTAIDQWIKAP